MGTNYINNDGEKKVFNRELLREKIDLAVGESSQISYGDLATDISYAVSKYIEQNKHTLFSITKINNFVVNLLNDAGYSEISFTYAMQNSGHLHVEKNAQFSEWNKKRVSLVLQKNPLFQSYSSEILVDHVFKNLQNMQLKLISDTLITEIANHVINNTMAKRNDEEFFDDPQFISITELQQFCAKSVRKYFSEKTIVIYEINKIFPKLHFEINFAKYLNFLQESEGELATMEIVFLPKWTVFIEEIAKSYDFILGFLHITFPYIKIPAIFSIRDFEKTLVEKFGYQSRKFNQFSKEMQKLVKSIFLQYCKNNVLIEFLIAKK